MDQSILGSREIMGMYFARLEASPGLRWVDGIANFFGSDQLSEEYAFLGSAPTLREWVGGRQPVGLRSSGLTIRNLLYEGTLEINVDDLRRDKTGQIRARVQEFADRELTHWATLLSALLVNGTSLTCYDGQYYFDTNHNEGDSGDQSNLIQVDISEVPASTHGSAVTAPSKEEAQHVILQAIMAIVSFVDDRGEPMNENACEFLVKVPPTLYPVFAAAVKDMFNSALPQNMDPNLLDGISVSVAMNTRLSSWTDQVAVFRTDSPIKGLIRQSETDFKRQVLDETSEYAFQNRAIQTGVDGWRNVGFGYWQRACLAKMI